MNAVANAQANGARVSCEATPHHLLLDRLRGQVTRHEDEDDPPLAGEADRQALIEGLRSGTIDCIATDHAPHARDEKEVPFEEAPMGTTGLERRSGRSTPASSSPATSGSSCCSSG